MFGLRRRQAKTHTELFRDELGESYDHLRQAAVHAAGGIGATVGPRVISAREQIGPATGKVRSAASQGWGTTVSALTPLTVAAVESAHQAGDMARKVKPTNLKATRKRKREREMARNRGFMLAGLLAAGAALGAVGALVARRRRQHKWEEYEPGQVLEPAASRSSSVKGSAREAARGAAEKTSQAAERAAEATSATAQKAADKVSTTAERGAEKVTSASEAAKEKAGSMSDPTSSPTTPTGAPSRNSRA